MTPQKAKVIFATHMQAARSRQLTAYEKDQLAKARQVLRTSRKPAMNPLTQTKAKEMLQRHEYTSAKQRRFLGARASGYPRKSNPRQEINTGDIVYYRTDKDRTKGIVQRVNRSSNQYWVRWEDGEYTVVRRDEIRRLLEGPKGTLPNPNKPVLIYGKVDRIYATKTQDHICDAECKKNGHRYFHDFASKPKMYGLPDGSLLIKK